MQERCLKCRTANQAICIQPRTNFACNRCNLKKVKCGLATGVTGPRRTLGERMDAPVKRFFLAPAGSQDYQLEENNNEELRMALKAIKIARKKLGQEGSSSSSG